MRPPAAENPGLVSSAAGAWAPALRGDANRRLRLVLRLLGAVDCLAFFAAVMPEAWMAALHQGLGLGVLPATPLVGYLTRSASLMYALHGVTIMFVSFDTARYRPLIALLAWAAVIHGLLLFAIDWLEGMPLWWTLLEGPAYCLMAAGVLLLLRRSKWGDGESGEFTDDGLGSRVWARPARAK